MKLTPKGKEVWDRVTVSHAAYPSTEKAGVRVFGDIPFGWTVAREALSGLLASGDGGKPITFDGNPVTVHECANYHAIIFCNKLAEVG